MRGRTVETNGDRTLPLPGLAQLCPNLRPEAVHAVCPSTSLVVLGADHKLDLIKQIESLEALPADIKDWAHQIRIFGNWGAHPDKDNLKEITEGDVSEAHDFISKFLMYTFVMPEKVKLSRAKRAEKLKKENPEVELG